jgi:predicted nucleic acid-binding protein
MILVDSSVWIDYFNGIDNGQTNYLHAHLGVENFATGDLILVEVLQGFRAEKDLKKARELLSELYYFDMLGQEMAYKSALNYRMLKKHGFTVRKTIDVIIATFCLQYKLALLHNDRDFKAIETALGLEVVKV